MNRGANIPAFLQLAALLRPRGLRFIQPLFGLHGRERARAQDADRAASPTARPANSVRPSQWLALKARKHPPRSRARISV